MPKDLVLFFLRARDCPEGNWKHFTIKDPDGNDVRFHHDEDKSSKTVGRESITKKFCNMLRETYGKDDPLASPGPLPGRRRGRFFAK